MKKKRWFTMIGSICLILVLAALLLPACAPATPEEAPAEPVRVATIYSISDPSRAGGWDRAQYIGGLVLEEEYGWELSIAEDVAYPKLATVAASYAAKGYDMVIFTSNGHTDAWMEVAPKYPDTWFMMMSLADDLPDSERVAAWSPDFYTYGTMVGVTAAKITKTGKIGVIGGVPIEVLSVIFSGVIEGAKALDPATEVSVSWVGDWVDLAKHSEVTKLHFERGADVIFTISGPGTKGILEATETAGAYFIGYASDWYNDAPAVVVTSVMVDTPPMYRSLAEMFLANKLERKITTLGLEQFTLADFRGMLPAETEAELREAIEKLKTGELKVPRVLHELK